MKGNKLALKTKTKNHFCSAIGFSLTVTMKEELIPVMLGVQLTCAKCQMDDMLLMVSNVAIASSVLPSMSRRAAYAMFASSSYPLTEEI